MIIERILNNEETKFANEYMKAYPIISIVDTTNKEVHIPQRILSTCLVDIHSKRMYDYVNQRYPNFKIVAV